MKYLCLAYGDEKDWHALSQGERDSLLAQDEVLRERGDLVAAVGRKATVLRAWNGKPETTDGPLADAGLPLADFGVIEAASLDEAIRLLADTPCARAKGAVEIRPIAVMNEAQLEKVR